MLLPVLAVALLATGCFQSSTAGTVTSSITVDVGTTSTAVNPGASASTPATTAAGTTSASTGATSSTTGTGATAPSYPPAAKAKFATTCGGCHTLANAGTKGTVGPNLDQLKPNEATVEHQIMTGGGPMPAGLLKGQDAKDVAAYVSAVAGKTS
ncbi:MAG TPA: cytochrome c [Gaiellales bacterium]|jgi:mono/diheme cytochrome c family protein